MAQVIIYQVVPPIPRTASVGFRMFVERLVLAWVHGTRVGGVSGAFTIERLDWYRLQARQIWAP